MTRHKIFLTIALLCAVLPGAWAQFSGGSGTEDDPYQISSVDDWIKLCTNVNNGTSITYSGEFFKLMADITVKEEFDGVPTKMVGRGENVNFRGTFDGGGHTLTVNYLDDNDENACAPFRYIRNATIKNLHVAGTITKNHKLFAGGLVGVAYGTCHISNCHSSVRIVCHDGDCSSGGFIGELGTSSDPDDTYIDNCFFDGRLEGKNSNSWGGFIGWVEDQPDAYITNCLFSPAYVYVNNEGNKTFARGDDIHLTNCYYKYLLTDAQGSTKARDMDNETLCMKLGVAWEVFAGQELPIMTPRPLTNGEGTEQSPYLIASISDWHRLATNVYLGENYNGKYFLMTQDISTSRMVGARPSTDVYNAFGGIFDGDVNGDGAITTTDVMLLVNHILGNDSNNFIEENANVNGDEVITVADVMVLVYMILNDSQKSFNVVTNLDDAPIGYDGGGSGPARVGENNLWEIEE